MGGEEVGTRNSEGGSLRIERGTRKSEKRGEGMDCPRITRMDANGDGGEIPNAKGSNAKEIGGTEWTARESR